VIVLCLDVLGGQFGNDRRELPVAEGRGCLERSNMRQLRGPGRASTGGKRPESSSIGVPGGRFIAAHVVSGLGSGLDSVHDCDHVGLAVPERRGFVKQRMAGVQQGRGEAGLSCRLGDEPVVVQDVGD
jgi:hypothetical protein